MISINKKTYNDCHGWDRFFKQQKSLKNIPIDESWEILFNEHIFNDKRIDSFEQQIKKDVEEGIIIVPKPQVVFNTFYVTPLENVKVVIIGQDPYFNLTQDNIPEAVGMSFSVPTGVNIPSSLRSIYDNLMKFNNIKFTPKNGNLIYWSIQGCIMLNTALTVQVNKKKSHTRMWQWVTDEIIRYISYNCNYVVFLLWGDAFDKAKLIDQDKHDIIVSSHPSGFSRAKPFREFPPFDKIDHFSKTNELLINHGKEPIIWQVP
jgi:uracil-DNA glycosylase